MTSKLLSCQGAPLYRSSFIQLTNKKRPCFRVTTESNKVLSPNLAKMWFLRLCKRHFWISRIHWDAAEQHAQKVSPYLSCYCNLCGRFLRTLDVISDQDRSYYIFYFGRFDNLINLKKYRGNFGTNVSCMGGSVIG